MKVRGLKQVFHLIFLFVGVLSLVMLAYTTSTYLSYAEEGYGVNMTLEKVWLNDNWLIVRMNLENPGSLDIEIDEANITLSQTYEFPHGVLPNGLAQEDPLAQLPAHETVSVVLWVPITDPDLGNIQATGQAEIDLELTLWVPKRYVNTELGFQGTVGVEL